MAINKIYASTQELHRDIPLADVTRPSAPANIQPGVPVLIASRPAVSLTASGNATKTQTTGLAAGVTSVTWENGGAGNSADPASATFAFDGTFEFAVTGAGTTTKNGVPVYITAAGALTTTAGSDILYGYTDYPKGYTKESGRAPIKVGA